MDTMYKFLQPQYVAKFNCIGSNCEDTCCANWERINIDKRTYAKYVTCSDLDLIPLINKYVSKMTDGKGDYPYGIISLDETSTCPFLTADRLCSIQKRLGEQYLSSTCTSYPRYVNVINGIIERSLLLSCPEAARLALQEQSPMIFEEMQVQNTAFPGRFKVLDKTVMERQDELYKYFHVLRRFIIVLLQNRSYPIEFRLIVLGLFCSDANQLIENKYFSNLPQLIETFHKSLSNNAIMDRVNSFSSDLSFQVQLITPIINQSTKHLPKTNRFLQYYNDFLQGIGTVNDSGCTLTASMYVEASRNWFQPFMETNPYIMENYLVNYVFQRLFPLIHPNVYDSYTTLVLTYVMIKVLLVGLAGNYREKFCTNQVLALIQSYTKTFDNTPFLGDVFNTLKHHGLNTMHSLAMLIKN
jgi:lysine-N-methylase